MKRGIATLVREDTHVCYPVRVSVDLPESHYQKNMRELEFSRKRKKGSSQPSLGSQCTVVLRVCPEAHKNRSKKISVESLVESRESPCLNGILWLIKFTWVNAIRTGISVLYQALHQGAGPELDSLSISSGDLTCPYLSWVNAPLNLTPGDVPTVLGWIYSSAN